MAKNRQTLGQRLFINRDYGLLFWGRLVSQVGDGVHYLALTWLVLDLTGSGTALGTMLFASSIPMVVLAPFTGVLADLWDRKTIVVSMDVLRSYSGGPRPYPQSGSAEYGDPVCGHHSNLTMRRTVWSGYLRHHPRTGEERGAG